MFHSFHHQQQLLQLRKGLHSRERLQKGNINCSFWPTTVEGSSAAGGSSNWLAAVAALETCNTAALDFLRVPDRIEQGRPFPQYCLLLDLLWFFFVRVFFRAFRMKKDGRGEIRRGLTNVVHYFVIQVFSSARPLNKRYGKLSRLK